MPSSRACHTSWVTDDPAAVTESVIQVGIQIVINKWVLLFEVLIYPN